MAIYCPYCAALSNLADSDIGAAGRMARCQQCGTTWLARVIGEDPYRRPGPLSVIAGPPDISDAIVIEHVGAGLDAPKARRATARSRAPMAIDRSSFKVVAGMVAVIVAIMVLRAPFVAAFPQFATIGSLPDDVGQLEFQKVRSETVGVHGVRTLFVEGEIINRSGSDVALPAVRISLRSSDGAEVRSWLVEPSAAGLAAGRSIGFRSALASPPAAATQVRLDLAAREGQTIGLR